MLNFIFRLLITMLALKGADLVLSNFNLHGGAFTLACFSIVLGLINWIIKPLLVFFSIPLILLTLGFFYLIINALMFYLASVLLPGSFSGSALGIFWGSLLVSIFHWALTLLFRIRRD